MILIDVIGKNITYHNDVALLTFEQSNEFSIVNEGHYFQFNVPTYVFVFENLKREVIEKHIQFPVIRETIGNKHKVINNIGTIVLRLFKTPDISLTFDNGYLIMADDRLIIESVHNIYENELLLNKRIISSKYPDIYNKIMKQLETSLKYEINDIVEQEQIIQMIKQIRGV